MARTSKLSQFGLYSVLLAAVGGASACSPAAERNTPAQAPGEEAAKGPTRQERERAAESSDSASATGPAERRAEENGKAAAAAPPASSAAPARPDFAPAAFTPPHAATQAPEDGTWTALGDSAQSEPAGEAPRTLYRASVHPHRKSRFVRMDVVAIDLRALRPYWVIGKKDQGADEMAAHAPVGLIPPEDQAATLAIFNGGFQARHGRWGMMNHGVTILPPRDIGCTLASYKDGSVAIAPWSELHKDGLESYRQAPPCLLHNGEVHPNLLNGNHKLWAGQHPTRKTRRRSAVGIDASGTTLFYAVGTETEAVDLARGMLALGASHAMQLDINWNWTRFLVVGRKNGQPRVTSTLIDDMAHGKNEYFTWAADRDFFYLAPRN